MLHIKSMRIEQSFPNKIIYWTNVGDFLFDDKIVVGAQASTSDQRIDMSDIGSIG